MLLENACPWQRILINRLINKVAIKTIKVFFKQTIKRSINKTKTHKQSKIRSILLTLLTNACVLLNFKLDD